MDESDDPILNQLIKLRHEFEKLLGHPISEPTEPKDLTLFGLTLDEARDWIQSEPDFKPNRSPLDKLTKYPLGEGVAS